VAGEHLPKGGKVLSRRGVRELAELLRSPASFATISDIGRTLREINHQKPGFWSLALSVSG
jgi:hypothetical protein